jgi:hypothetical protein
VSLAASLALLLDDPQDGGCLDHPVAAQRLEGDFRGGSTPTPPLTRTPR